MLRVTALIDRPSSYSITHSLTSVIIRTYHSKQLLVKRKEQTCIKNDCSQNTHLISITDSRQSVCYDKNCSVLHGTVNGLLHIVFTFCIQSTCCLERINGTFARIIKMYWWSSWIDILLLWNWKHFPVNWFFSFKLFMISWFPCSVGQRVWTMKYLLQPTTEIDLVCMCTR